MSARVRPTTAVGLVYASTAFTWVAYALLAVTLPFRFESLGLSVVQYGIAVAVLALGMLLTETAWGVFASRIGSVRTIVSLGIVVGLLYVAVGASTTFLTLTISLGLLGALFIFQVPLMRWIALTALGPGTSGRGTGLYGLFSGVGLVLGTAVGPFLFVEIGFGSLTLLIVGTYAVGLTLSVLLPWGKVAMPPRQSGFGRHVRAVFHRPFGLAVALVIVAFLAKPLVWNFLQYYSVSLFHGTPSAAGYVIGAAQGTSLIAGAAFGALVDRRGPARSVPLGFVLLIVGALGTWAATSYAGMIGATIVFATGVGWLAASLLPLALAPVRPELQGTAVGVFGSFEDLGLLVGPILISAAYTAYGPASIFLLVAAIGFAGAVLSTGVLWGASAAGGEPAVAP